MGSDKRDSLAINENFSSPSLPDEAENLRSPILSTLEADEEKKFKLTACELYFMSRTYLKRAIMREDISFTLRFKKAYFETNITTLIIHC